MSISNPVLRGHLSNDLLIRSMDEELTGAETVELELHLKSCEHCRERQAQLRHVSDGVDSFMQSLQSSSLASKCFADDRQILINRLGQPRPAVQPKGAVGILVRFGWALAAAATVAISLSYIPFSHFLVNDTGSDSSKSAHVSQPGSPFEIDGETFQYLPYSNPDLPLGGSHIVQMQVPLSSLTDAGVLIEPAVNRISMPDRAVLADVLLGLDGQPIGVHVLSAD